MKEVNTNSWEEFLSEISKIEENYGTHKSAGYNLQNLILFRGQSDTEWKLDSTLKRYRPNTEWTFSKYVSLLKRCIPEIASFTGQNWEFYSDDSIWEGEGLLPLIEYWIYMRQCGFPSPLLDWTKSPYIASFFAFEKVKDVEKAAVFAYIETPKGLKGYAEGIPKITIQEALGKTHIKHFLQQAYYTICTQKVENEQVFIDYENVFSALPSKLEKQDTLLKITIPRNERSKVLSYLNKYNINSFSLFQTEESLMQTLAFKKIDLREN